MTFELRMTLVAHERAQVLLALSEAQKKRLANGVGRRGFRLEGVLRERQRTGAVRAGLWMEGHPEIVQPRLR